MTAKRVIEVFTAGCPCCEDAIQLVRSAACPSCDVRVLEMRSDPAAQARATALGIRRVPTMVIDGRVAGCCSATGVDLVTLRTLGLGQA